MSLPVARMGDKFSDDDTIGAGSGDVFMNGMPAARMTDMTTGHYVPGHGFYPPAPIITGSSSVFVNGLPLVRFTDKHAPHCDTKLEHDPPPDCHDGVIITSSGSAFCA